MSKYYIKTFGCQANIADSNSMMSILESLGFEQVPEPVVAKNEDEALKLILKETDLFIVNTCSVRQKSEDKVYGLGKGIKFVNETYGHKPFVVMSGCMVGSVTGERQRYEFEKLQKKTPWVNVYLNPAQIFDLPEVLRKEGILDEWALKKYKPSDIHRKLDTPDHAFINVSYGCDNFCTFCVVPYARGKEVSRTKEEILKEIDHFILRGVKEITLCGQNVNSWGLEVQEKMKIRTGSDQKLPFAQLLRDIHEKQGIDKISFLSSNPFDFTQDLLDVLKLPRISNYLHIAVQSGNNRVLKRMNRRHTIEDFISLADAILKVKPDMELGTDLIVGFPGETREQFLDTVKLVQRVKFNVAYIAMYSPRQGTVADKLYPDDVPAAEKKWRHSTLTKAWKDSLK